MKLKNLKQLSISGGTRLECYVEDDATKVDRLCFIEIISDAPLTVRKKYDPFVIGLLPVAMASGGEFRIAGAVDLELHANLCDAAALFKTWFPAEVQGIRLVSDGYSRDAIKGERIASFFSGGVDSLFNYAFFDSQYPEAGVTDLLLVHGMDIGLEDSVLWEETRDRLGQTARSLGKNFVTVKTNLRDFQNNSVKWVHTGFGPILGSVANALAPEVSLTLIGSYGLFSELAPHASGPLVDRLWSSSAQNVIHYTPRFTRLEKIRLISELSPQSLKYLRVCWKNTGAHYNCGVCEKCLRTRMELRIAGSTDLAESFPSTDISEDIARLQDNIPADDIYTYYFWKEIALLEKDPKVRFHVVRSLRSFERRRRKYLFRIMKKKLIRSVKRFVKSRFIRNTH